MLLELSGTCNVYKTETGHIDRASWLQHALKHKAAVAGKAQSYVSCMRLKFAT